MPTGLITMQKTCGALVYGLALRELQSSQLPHSSLIVSFSGSIYQSIFLLKLSTETS
jgi:hypothetical protein